MPHDPTTDNTRNAANELRAPAAPRRWTDADIEAFHDGELPEDAARALAADRAADPALDRRLRALRLLDADTRAVLLTTPDRSASRPFSSTGVIAGALAAVAAVVIVSAAWLAVVFTPGSARLLGSGDRPVPHGPAPEPAAPPARHAFFAGPPIAGPGSSPGTPTDARSMIIASVTIPAAARPDAAPEERPPAAEARVALAGRERRPRDVGGLVAAARDASGAEREEIYLELGAVLRSAMLANQALDSLPPEEQLAACELWAREPRLRPVAFERLARLRDDPTLSAPVAALAQRLAADQSLASWVRSYGLVADAATPEPGASSGQSLAPEHQASIERAA